jgi:hypothetical protein
MTFNGLFGFVESGFDPIGSFILLYVWVLCVFSSKNMVVNPNNHIAN